MERSADDTGSQGERNDGPGLPRTVVQWALLGASVGVACGVASAVFLLALDRATRTRVEHPWLVYLLPVAGLAVGLVYRRWGASVRGGNNLVIDTVHEGSAQVPVRMAPMVLLATVTTHLFGGSAGREGTAVQMGASLADALSHSLKVSPETRRQLLAAGMAGGFGSVFGTPIAGALFGLEVVCVGRVEYEALAPALVAALVGDFVTRHLGVVHMTYPTLQRVELTPLALAQLLVMGAAMAGAAIAFIELTHRLKALLERRIPSPPWRAFAGGLAVVGLWKIVGTDDYLGLGVPTIVRAFSDPTLASYAFAAKIVFTSITLASGFVGGEVTPLFFVGATLGSVVARTIGLPMELGAGVGMAAVFGAAANTPIALSIMAVELLGGAAFPHVVIVCVTAYVLSGHRSIYPSQRILRWKSGGPAFGRAVPLRDAGSPVRKPAGGA